MSRSHPIWLLILILLAGALQSAPGEVETVQSIKDRAAADFKVETDRLKMKYLIALEKLQNDLAKAGDLDAALAVKREREQADKQEVTLEADKPVAGSKFTENLTGTIILLPEDAALGNGATLDRNLGIIKGFSRYGAYAAWKIASFAPGNYRVKLNYRAGNLGGGLLSIRTMKRNERFTLTGSGRWDEVKTYDLGSVYLAAPESITIGALKAQNREMIYIDSVVLEPQ